MGGLQLAHQDVIGNALKAGFQNFVDQSATLIATTATGTPASGYFHSTVVGRAAIPDISADLRASLGIERIMVQNIYQLTNEFGSSGEPVFAATNDDRGLIRYIGSWINTIGAGGAIPGGGVNGADYAEVTFYGTDLNVIAMGTDASNRGYTVSVDGVGSSTITVQGSPVHASQGYCANIPIPLNLGLTLGVHTVKIRFTNVVGYMAGFEIINNNTSNLANINAGTAYINGQKVLKSVVNSIHYNKDTSNNTLLSAGRGGRIVRYLKDDGTIGQATQAVNSATAYFPNADHTNEEVVRVYSWREFGCGRVSSPDDFSTPTTAPANFQRAFVLDDGSTSLYGYNIGIESAAYLNYWDATQATYWCFTFVGTGLDIMFKENTNARVPSLTVDGVSVTLTQGTSANKLYKVVSGLPYGTHIVRYYAAVSGSNPPPHCPIAFYAYQPKKPSIPSAAVEICDYNVLGNFVANVSGNSASHPYLSSGVLRKAARREFYYGGTWGGVINTDMGNGWEISTTTNGSTARMVFFGTGFDLRFQSASSAGANTFQVSVDGSTNLSGFTTSFYGYTGHTLGWTASSGQLTGNSVAEGGLVVSGLTPGLHTVIITYNNPSAAKLILASMDLITPIHSVKSNIYADLQNTLPVGSCALTDSRKTSAVKEILPSQKAWAQAIGVTSAPSVNTTTLPALVPTPDLSLTIKTNGGPLEIFYSITWSITAGSPSGTSMGTAIFVDGVQVTESLRYVTYHSTSINYTCANANKVNVPLSAGTHKVDVFWSTNGTSISGYGTQRILTAKEL